ncbi:unnamed protein product [Phytomonas sp. EM1]|nr:unnamed protein product [Phytomonas sp. EM1]|eukprot:CCW59604.1 unnamed protein product [Phytomonas sp. isolate EM1]
MCERIPPQDFHGASAQQYTEKCVDDLVNGKQFKAYVRHVEYSERLYLTWFVVLFGLIAAVCHHLYFFDPNYLLNPLDTASLKQMEDQASLVPTLPYVALFASLYLFPCAIIAPFVGFFELPTAFSSVISYVILTALNCAVVLFGGAWCHHPPFLNTEPALSWRISLSRDGAWMEILRYLFIRAAPLQGFLTAGFLVARWRRTFWARLWHIPFPLISVPLLVGIFGALCWQFTVLLQSYLLDVRGEPTDVSVYLWGSAISDPQGVISLSVDIVKEVMNTMVGDLQKNILARELPPSLRNSILYLNLYLASLLMTLLYFVAMLVKPMLARMLNGVLFFFPTHPTTWGITLLSSFAFLAVLLNMDEVPIFYVVGIAHVIAGLFYNGFVA